MNAYVYCFLVYASVVLMFLSILMLCCYRDSARTALVHRTWGFINAKQQHSCNLRTRAQLQDFFATKHNSLGRCIVVCHVIGKKVLLGVHTIVSLIRLDIHPNPALEFLCTRFIWLDTWGTCTPRNMRSRVSPHQTYSTLICPVEHIWCGETPALEFGCPSYV